MANFDLTIARGDGRTLEVTATYPTAIPLQSIAAGDPYPLNDKTLYFTARKSYGESSSVTPILTKTSGSGITVRSAPNTNVADITITSADTENVAVHKLYCDVRSKQGGNDPITLAEGVLTIQPNATRI